MTGKLSGLPNIVLAIITENIGESLWNAIRAIEESVMILNHMGEHFAKVNQISRLNNDQQFHQYQSTSVKLQRVHQYS